MADLSEFATQDKAEEGVWFPVKLYGKSLPMAILIYGDDCDAVQEYNREKLRKIKVDKNGSIDNEVFDEILDSADDEILIKIGGVSSYDLKKKECTTEPLTLFGKELKNDRRSYKFLIEKMPAIKDFVKEKSNERKNFLSDGKKN